MLAAIMDFPSLTSAAGWPRRTWTIGFSLHHTVTPFVPSDFNANGIRDADDEIEALRQINAYHLTLDFGGMGYHALCFASGRWYKSGLDPFVARAGVKDRNHELYHIAAIGDYSQVTPAALLQQALSEAIVDAIEQLGDHPFAGHRYYALPGSGTACPGDAFLALGDNERLVKRVRLLLRPEDLEIE